MLTLRYFPEDERHGELRVEAGHVGFSGKASAWFNADALRQFAQPLRAWPPAVEAPVKLQGGYFSDSTTSSTPVETLVDIGVQQIGKNGRYRVRALLAEPDDEILPQSATVCFFVEPVALMRFATQVEIMLASGGSVTLPASGGDTSPDTATAPCAIERPYTPLFMGLREQCSAMIERMVVDSADHFRTVREDDTASTCRSRSAPEIMARIDWDRARLELTWADWQGEEWAIGDPLQASWSPTYPLDLGELKQAALAKPHPRAWFESYALFVLSIAQDFLGDFFRDGPTDDIPFQRHLIFAHGTARNPDPVWIKHVLFRYEDR